MSKAKLIVPGLFVAVTFLAACASDKSANTSAAAAPKSINTNCPISGKPVSGTNTVAYKGQTIGFCCGNCPNTWAKLSDAEKDAKVAAFTKK